MDRVDERSRAERAAGAVGRVLGSLGGGVVEGFRSEGRLAGMQFEPWHGQHGSPAVEDLTANEKAYKVESWVYAAVYAIASQGASVPLMMYQASDPDFRKWKKLPGHPVLELLQNPNEDAEETDFDLLEAFFSDWELSGNWYMYVIRDADGKPLRLYRMRPGNVKPVPSRTRRIDHYVYTVGGQEEKFGREDVGQSKTFNPFSDVLGLSSLAAARYAVMNDIEAQRSNLTFFANNSVPPGFIEMPAGTSKQTVERMTEQLKKEHQGTKNQHRLGILIGGQFHATGVSHDDMQFIEQRRMNREEILACFHVPPAIVGVHEYSNYANMEGQLQAFWHLTMIPKLQKMERALTRILCRPYDKSLRLKFDMTNVWAMIQSAQVMADVDTRLIQCGMMTINERRAERGLPPKPWGDVAWMQIQYQPIDGPDAGAYFQRALPDPTTDSAKRVQPEVKGLRMYRNKRAAKARDIAWQTVVAPSRKQFTGKVLALLAKQESEVLAKIGAEKRTTGTIHELVVGRAKNLAEGEPVTREILKQAASIEIESWLFDYETWVDGSRKAVHATLLNAANSAGIFAMGEVFQAIGQVDVDVQFDLADPNVQRAIEEKEFVFAQNWNETTLGRLRDTLSEGVAEGENKAELVERVNQAFEHRKNNAEVVAQTEVGEMCNAGAHEGRVQSGVVSGEEWHTGGPNPRAHHAEANGQVKPLDGVFFVGGETLRWPGDPLGREDNICNCHCDTYAVLKEV